MNKKYLKFLLLLVAANVPIAQAGIMIIDAGYNDHSVAGSEIKPHFLLLGNNRHQARLTANLLSARKGKARQRIDHLIEKAASTYSVDRTLIHAVIRAESNYNPHALSPKGARGLMQLMPATARRYGVTNRYDPKQNIKGGTRYLHDLLQMFNGNVRLAVAAYNAGEQNVVHYGYHVPPFPETRDYVDKVTAGYWGDLRN